MLLLIACGRLFTFKRHFTDRFLGASIIQFYSLWLVIRGITLLGGDGQCHRHHPHDGCFDLISAAATEPKIILSGWLLAHCSVVKKALDFSIKLRKRCGFGGDQPRLLKGPAQE